MFAENQTKGDKEEEKTRIVNNRTDPVTFGNLRLVFREGGKASHIISSSEPYLPNFLVSATRRSLKIMLVLKNYLCKILRGDHPFLKVWLYVLLASTLTFSK